MAIAAWPVCKYVLSPFLEPFGNKQEHETLRQIAQSYEKMYCKTVEERARVTIELANKGKDKKEISDYLDASLPIPEQPEVLNEIGD